MHAALPLMLMMVSCLLLGTQAEALEPGPRPHAAGVQAIREAAHAVDAAWEIYHRAALGGTVASPGLQADIEKHLDEARTLMTQMQEAADRGDTRQMERLVGQIKGHAFRAIEASRERKR